MPVSRTSTPLKLCRRPAVLAYTLRSREQMRRVLRSLGCSPMVFSTFGELEATGARAANFDVLFLGDVPDMDSEGNAPLASASAITGRGVPIVHVPMHRAPRPPRRGEAADGLAAPRFFGELYLTMLSFLVANGFRCAEPRLAWGVYAFDPVDLSCHIGNERIQLDPVAFDVALELFFNAGEMVSRKWLRRMLPSGERGAIWHRIDNIGCTVEDLCVAIRLNEANGWVLDEMGLEGYRLHRVRATGTPHPAPSAPERPPKPPNANRRRMEPTP